MFCTGNCVGLSAQNKNVSFILAIVFAFIAVIFNIISFVSPYWIIASDGTNVGFKRLGLWEICFENFIFPEDYVSKAYQGCWYVYYPEYKYIRFWLNPPWFYAVQMLSIVALICNLVSLIMIIMTMCEVFTINELRPHYIIIIFQFIAFACFIVMTVYMGVMSKDRSWLPRSDLNELSWSFAFSVLAGFFTIFCLFGLLTHYLSLRSKLFMEDPLYQQKHLQSDSGLKYTRGVAGHSYYDSGQESKMGYGTATIPSLFTAIPSTYIGYSNKSGSGLHAPGTVGTSAANVSAKLRQSLDAQRAAVCEASAYVGNTHVYNSLARQSTIDSRFRTSLSKLPGYRESVAQNQQPTVAMDSAV